MGTPNSPGRGGYGFWEDSRGYGSGGVRGHGGGSYGFPDSGYNSAWVNLHEATPLASSLGTSLVPLPAKSENSQVSWSALKAPVQLASSFPEAATLHAAR